MPPKDLPQPSPQDAGQSGQPSEAVQAEGNMRPPLFIEAFGAQVLRELTPQELGRSDAEVVTTAEGFNIGGRNESSLIRSLTSLNGVSIDSLERRMRSGMTEFLGRNESLLEVMVTDNDTVLGMGLTHQQIADFLSYFGEAARFAADQTGQTPRLIQFNGRTYTYGVSRGMRTIVLASPFGDGAYGAQNEVIVCLDDGSKIHESVLMPTLIRNYGFYGGRAAGGIGPTQIAEMAGFIPRAENDPIVQLVRDRNTNVVISTDDQINRMRNLIEVGIDLLNAPNFQLIPENSESFIDLVSYLYQLTEYQRRMQPTPSTNNLDLLALHLVPSEVLPTDYQLDPRRIQFFTEELPNIPSELEAVVLSSMNRIILNPRNEHPNREFIQTLVSNIQGDTERRQYYVDILKKVAIQPESIIDIIKGIAPLAKGTNRDSFTGAVLMDETRLRDVAAILQEALPTLREELVRLNSQLGNSVPEDITLERLIQNADKLESRLKAKKEQEEWPQRMARMERAEEARVKQETRRLVEVAKGFGVATATEADMQVLIAALRHTLEKPLRQYRPYELEAMGRLNVNPELIRYAFKGTSPHVLETNVVVPRLYNGQAEKIRVEENEKKS